MNITRNNYETFFLLYADGELNEADMQAVQDFIQQQPDLQEELDLLMETVMEVPEFITMPGKDKLLKPETWEETSISAEQEKLLLLLDNELPETAATPLLESIAKDDRLRKEFELLQASKLSPLALEMPEMERLYRTAPIRRPISIRVMRWVAAAAVIAGLGWFTLSVINNSPIVDGQQVASTEVDKPANQANAEATTTPKAATAEVAVTDLQDKSTEAPADQSPAPSATEFVMAAAKHQKIVDEAGGGTTIAANTADKNGEQLMPKKNLALVDTYQEKKINSNAKATIDLKEIDNPIASNPVTQQQPPIAMQAAYHEDAYAADSQDDEYVTIAGAHIKKQKLRGLFRNVTRTVSRGFDKSNVAQVDVASLR